MSNDWKRAPWQQWEWNEDEEPPVPPRAVSPGKRTLTMHLPPRPTGVPGAVQLKRDPAAVIAREEHAPADEWLDTAMRPDLYQEPAPSARATHIQREATGATAPDASALDELPSSPGSPVDAGMRERFESTTGERLGDVRVHTGTPSAAAAERLGARAFTVGQDIHFAAGESPTDQHLMAHELTHTVQQRGQRIGGNDVSMPGDPHELAADTVADAVIAGQPAALPHTTGTAHIHREPDKSSGDDVGKKLRELNGQSLASMCAAIKAMPPEERTRLRAGIDSAGVDVRRVRLAFDAADAAGTSAAAFFFAHSADLLGLEYVGQRKEILQQVDPAFKEPPRLEPGDRLPSGKGIVHRAHVNFGGNLAWQCENPGAIGHAPAVQHPEAYPGKTAGPAHIAVFPDWMSGMGALRRWMEFHANRGVSFRGFFGIHAPTKAGTAAQAAANKGNDPNRYFNEVTKTLGIDPAEAGKLTLAEVLRRYDPVTVAEAMGAVEAPVAGQKLAFTDAQIPEDDRLPLYYWAPAGGQPGPVEKQ